MRRFKVGDEVLFKGEKAKISVVHENYSWDYYLDVYKGVYNFPVGEKNLTSAYTHPTYDILDIKNYNLSPEAFKKDNELKVGDLVYVSYPKKTGLAFLTRIPYEGSGDWFVKFIGEENEEDFGEWHLHKDHPAINELREYFKQK
jgi:hypothetical protein